METALEKPLEKVDDALAEQERVVARQAAEIERLKERIRWLEKALFGPRSERLLADDGRQLEFEAMLKELEQLQGDLEGEPEPEPEAAAKPSAPRRRGTRRDLRDLVPDDLPREEIVIDVPEEDRISPVTGEPLVRIGETVVEKLACRPAQYFLKCFVYPSYADPAAPLAGVVRAPAPDFAIPGGQYDESFLAAIAVDKCAMHLPLYRQAERLANLGLDIGRQTLSRLYCKSADVLLPLYLALKAEILSRGVLFTDDTPVRLQVKGKGKTVEGRMWVYVGGGPGPPLRIFEFTTDRKKRRPAEFLRGYSGFLHADAYKGYEGLFGELIRECACWMHIRRKFFEALDGPPEVREEVLRLIRMMYRYERVLAGKPPETVVAVRQERVAPLIDRILTCTADALLRGGLEPKSKFAEAISYLHNRGDAVRTFLGDARLRPDNGESERALRPLAIGRKNWLFAGSENGGDATGILLSLVQSCRVLGIDPLAYLDDVLRRINGHPACRIAELLPHNWKKAQSYYA